MQLITALAILGILKFVIADNLIVNTETGRPYIRENKKEFLDRLINEKVYDRRIRPFYSDNTGINIYLYGLVCTVFKITNFSQTF